jgi:hypothetical protein
VFVIDLNNSAPRWLVVPTPAEPTVSLPGFAFAWSIKPLTLVTARPGRTTNAFCTDPSSATGARSLLGS